MHYTHQLHAKRCYQAAQQGHVLASTHLQIKIQGVGHCAKLLNAWDTSDSLQMWSITLERYQNGKSIQILTSCAATRATQCSGIDGKCVCAGEGQEEKPSAQSALAFSLAEDSANQTPKGLPAKGGVTC